MLATLGCASGLLVAEWLSAFTATLIPSVLSRPSASPRAADWRVAAFAIAVSLASAVSPPR